MDATKKQKLLDKSKEGYTSCTSKKTVDSCVVIEHYIKVQKLNTSSYPSLDSHHMMEKNIAARPVTQKPYKEDLHVRQLWTI